MNLQYNFDKSGDLTKAVAAISQPAALILLTTADNFETHVAQLAEKFPGIPSIGGIAMSYAGTQTIEEGVTLISLHDVECVADTLEHLSTMPVKYIQRLEKAIDAVGATPETSACFDLCSGHDGKLVTTLNMVLENKKIPLVGGTVDGGKVAVNGKIYDDACAFLILRNKAGKICVYKENLYTATSEQFLATKTDPKNYLLIEVDGKPAENFYREILHISKEDVATQTFKNPLGRVYGSETYLISIKDIKGNALECYKQVNNLDILTLMEIGNYEEIVSQTLQQIKKDIPDVKGILSVNCLFRYLFFKDENYLDTYLTKMNSSAMHAGLVGLGEHYKKQHINQTMCCIAFD